MPRNLVHKGVLAQPRTESYALIIINISNHTRMVQHSYQLGDFLNSRAGIQIQVMKKVIHFTAHLIEQQLLPTHLSRIDRTTEHNG